MDICHKCTRDQCDCGYKAIKGDHKLKNNGNCTCQTIHDKLNGT